MTKNLLILVGLILVLILVFSNKPTQITNFEECIIAGNPAMESYPRQCRDPLSDRTFTEVVDDYWRFDTIHLMRNEIDGTFGCFGCGKSKEGPRICIDPSREMKMVEETENKYCDKYFEIIENQEYSGNVGEKCSINSECKTPMEFLVQSNCPFGSVCINSKCKVVCGISFHDPSPEISKTYPYTCEINSECDCSERGNRTLKCVCFEGKCLSIEAE